MAAGIQVSRATLDTVVGQNARTLIAMIKYFNDLNTWIANVAGGFSGITNTSGIFGSTAYTDVPSGSGDASRLFNGCADGAQLYTIFHGSATLGSTKNFEANLDFLTGTPS